MAEESDGAHSIKPAAGHITVFGMIYQQGSYWACWSVLQAVAFCRRLSTVLSGRVMAKIGDRGLKRGLIGGRKVGEDVGLDCTVLLTAPPLELAAHVQTT